MLNLARYDPSYDVRDRARFLRALTIPQHNQEQSQSGLDALKEHAKRILFSDKEPPAIDTEGKKLIEVTLIELLIPKQ